MITSTQRAVGDLLAGLRSPRVWLLLAWTDLEARYRRTILGTFWQTLTMAGYILGLAFVFGAIRGRDLHDYLLYLAAGITAWQLIVGFVAEGASTFFRGANLLRAYNLPASLHIFRVVVNNYITFAHGLVILILVYFYTGNVPNLYTLWVIPAIILFFFMGIGIVMCMGLLGARFRDVDPAVATLMSFLFIMTPIFWQREDLTTRQWIADYNPFYHLVQLIRSPIMGEAPSLTNWSVGLSICVVSLVVGTYSFIRHRQQITYWL